MFLSGKICITLTFLYLQCDIGMCYIYGFINVNYYFLKIAQNIDFEYSSEMLQCDDSDPHLEVMFATQLQKSHIFI